MATPNAGAWCIRAVTSGTTVPTTEVNTNLDFGCYVGFGLRFPWETVETGRINVTSAPTGTTLAINTDHPTISSGATLSFDYGSGMVAPVVVTLTATCSSGSGTLTVASSAGVTAGARAGVYSDTILNNGYALSFAKGLKFKPRFMAGQWTPAHVETDGAPFFDNSDGHAPYPFIDSAGSPNLVFEKAYRQFARHLYEWSAAKNIVTPNSVAMIDMSNYSHQYSELYYGVSGDDLLLSFGDTGQGVRNAGYMITCHNRLVDIAWDEIGSKGLAFGYGLSGKGNLYSVPGTASTQPGIAPGIAQHMATNWPDSPLVYMQGNGWGYLAGSSTVGAWGSTQETVFQQNVWNKNTRRAMQDISPPDPRQPGEWDEMVDHALFFDCTYTETYTYQGFGDVPTMNATTGVHNEMIAAHNRFNSIVLAVEPTLTPPGLAGWAAVV